MTMPIAIFRIPFMAFMAIAHVVAARGATASAQNPWSTLDGSKPLVVGHRGASGTKPEHTMESYREAIAQGADAIEPDLVMTKDRVLISRHDLELGKSTNIATLSEFAGRKSRKIVDGIPQEGWFVCDFTLDEIRRLGGIATDPERSRDLDGKAHLATFEEILELAKATRSTGHPIVVYPETKHPTFHRDLGMALEDSLAAILRRAGWTSRDAPVIVQSFEPGSLRRLRSLGLKTRMVQLLDASENSLHTGELEYRAPNHRPFEWTRTADSIKSYAWMTTDAGLAYVKSYADGIGPWKRYLLPLRGRIDSTGAIMDLNEDGKLDDRDGILQASTDLVRRAHSAGLFVHPFTFRNESRRLAWDHRGDPADEYRRFYEMGIDGLFTDFPSTAIAARNRISSSILHTADGRRAPGSDTIVLLIDFQYDFADPRGAWPAQAPLAQQTIAAARQLVDTARSRGWPVLRIANEFSRRDFFGNLFRRQAAIQGSLGARLVAPFDSLDGPVFSKSSSDAFSSRKLSDWLANHPGSTLWVSGFFTEGCVASTTGSALRRGHRVLSNPSLSASPDSSSWRRGWRLMLSSGLQLATLPPDPGH
ncbi:MAG: isochorismatase family protein [Fibrobacteres bacterium]|jgi:glycerophosphoryl diester phosphodiesterase|nr:isochorismatase family protein [Fibrobacterota bacterium]